MYNPHTQRIELSPDGFLGVTDKGNQVAGRAFLKELGLDPDVCKVIVLDSGFLQIRQGRTTMEIKLGSWRRAK